MTPHSTLPPLLALPRELKDEILSYIILPEYVYTSSTTKETHGLYRSRRASGESYVDTRIYLPSHPPANILETCRQLRQECLERHVRLFNPSSSKDEPMSNILAERLGSEFAEAAERACDDGTPRITLEIQRQLRGPHGYYIPLRDELSPRFLALLPLFSNTRKLRLTIWPGFDWWNGGPQTFVDRRGNTRINPDVATKPNAASVAIGKILGHLPYVEDLRVDVLMHASDGSRWDLSDRKWEGVQPWLDSTIVPDSKQVVRVTRRLISFWNALNPEPFYTQYETRQDAGNSWKIERKGDMGTPSMLSMCGDEEDLEFLKSLVVEESFDRTD